MSKEFKVLDITEMAKPSKAGGIATFYRHKILTKGGTVLNVDIEEGDFTAEKAAPLLLAKATEADKIKAL